ncbi:hypothetical protein Zmor_016293 [Zophobas morio]|uniref:Uncharacterized protein n=1 Tax=Zophobas morio TaxID=2755281 RepID=A0AA38HHS6_9CUCU|nr:hypothetical protein Zmor_016293 [Zophobas morio]
MMADFAANNKEFGSLASLAGINITEDNAAEAMDIVIQILEALLNYDRSNLDGLNINSTIDNFNNAFNESTFKLNTIHELDKLQPSAEATTDDSVGSD